MHFRPKGPEFSKISQTIKDVEIGKSRTWRIFKLSVITLFRLGYFGTPPLFLIHLWSNYPGGGGS